MAKKRLCGRQGMLSPLQFTFVRASAHTTRITTRTRHSREAERTTMRAQIQRWSKKRRTERNQLSLMHVPHNSCQDCCNGKRLCSSFFRVDDLLDSLQLNKYFSRNNGCFSPSVPDSGDAVDIAFVVEDKFINVERRRWWWWRRRRRRRRTRCW